MPASLGIQTFKRIQRKSLWIMILLSVLYVLIFFYIEYTSNSRAIEEDKTLVRNQVVQAFQAETKRLVSFYSTRVQCHLAAPEALQAMKDKDHLAIYQSAKPKFDILNNKNPFITHMQFFAPDGTSLLRVHNEGVYGDNIAEKRPMVAYAMETQSSVSGFEEGLFGLVFRVIEPAFDKAGNYIGSLEFGFQPLYFEKVIKELFPDMKVGMVIPKNTLKIYQDSGRYETYKDYYVMGEDIEAIKPFIGSNHATKPTQTVDVEGRPYLLFSDVFLDNFEGNSFIQLLMLKDLTLIQDRFYTQLKETLFLGLLLLLLMWLASHFVLNYFMQNAANLHNQLAQSHTKLSAIFNASIDGIAVLDSEASFVDANPAFCHSLGYSVGQIKGLSLQKMVSDKHQQAVNDRIQALYSGSDVEKEEYCFVTQSNKTVLLEFSMVVLPEENHILMTSRDITLLRKQQKEIADYLSVVDKYVVTSKTDLQGRITYVSEAFSHISGFSKEELIGQTHSIVKHPGMPTSLYESMWQTITQGHSWHGDIKNRRKDGSSYWVSAVISPDFDEEGQIVGYKAIRQDITDKKRIQELSITDALTGLYNRRYYAERFNEVFNQRKREQLPFLFVLIDLDSFKVYNDTYGHPKGDEALALFSNALKASFQRNSDTLFRLGGEEFAAILHVDEETSVDGVLSRLHKKVADLKIVHEGNAVSEYLTISVGACLVKHYSAGLDQDLIYNKTDKALYRAKQKGRNQSVVEVI
ncbi:MAG: diguanylate cyclase [Thiotrichales bacterium]|nr:diguanylate cyclase [Thiotrichales bacterium]